MEDLKSKTVKLTEAEMDWASVDEAITQGTCKLKTMANSIGANPKVLRDLLATHYGTRVEFRRGKHGGVMWAKSPAL